MSSTLESYELIRFAEAFEARLATAGEMLAGRPGLESEKRWLADALELVRTTRAPSAGVLDRVKDLPELEEAREEYAIHQQGLWVDALEKLHAGITFTASSRAPVIEALFPHVKFPQLRRAPREAVIEYATSYERRTKSAYVTRIFARDDFALVRPVMEQVAAAHAAWRSSHEPAPLTPEVETVLREELVALGRKLEMALRQARLLSEAAVVPVPSVYEAAALGLKPKRRAGRGLITSAEDGLLGLGEEPVDSMEPTAAELAEVAALDAGGTGAQEPSDTARDDLAAEGVSDTEQAGDTETAGSPGPQAGDDAVHAEGAPAPDASEPVPAPTEEGTANRVAEAHDVDETARSTAPTGASAPSSPDGATLDGTAPNGAPAAAGSTAEQAPAPSNASTSSGAGKAARGRAASPPPGEAPVANESRDGAETAEAASEASSEAQGETRAARKGRKKAEAPSPPADTSSAEAQAPRVRKKKAAPAPGAPGSDTP